MIINLNFNLKDLDGTEIQDTNAGKILARQLSGSSKGDALKLWDWAQKLFKGDPLDLDPSDLQTLKGFVQENEQITNILEAQILLVLLDSKKK
jgi:hypothetical protein